MLALTTPAKPVPIALPEMPVTVSLSLFSSVLNVAGYTANADVNAAYNILRIGMVYGASACDDEVILVTESYQGGAHP